MEKPARTETVDPPSPAPRDHRTLSRGIRTARRVRSVGRAVAWGVVVALLLRIDATLVRIEDRLAGERPLGFSADPALTDATLNVAAAELRAAPYDWDAGAIHDAAPASDDAAPTRDAVDSAPAPSETGAPSFRALSRPAPLRCDFASVGNVREVAADGREREVTAVDFCRTLRARTTVVAFWATWCRPCREELPILEEAVARAEGVRLVLANCDDPLPDAGARTFRRFWPDGRARASHVVPACGWRNEYRAGLSAGRGAQIPWTFVVGSDGRVTAEGVVRRADELRRILNETTIIRETQPGRIAGMHR